MCLCLNLFLIGTGLLMATSTNAGVTFSMLDLGRGVSFTKVVQQGGQISPWAAMGISSGNSSVFPGGFDVGAADESGAGHLLICRKLRSHVPG